MKKDNVVSLNYGGKQAEADLELLYFIEKNAGSARSAKKDYMEMLEKQMNNFFTKYGQKYKEGAGEKLKENTEICFALRFASIKDNKPAQKRDEEMERTIQGIIDGIIAERKAG